jgi:hypothetical protein
MIRITGTSRDEPPEKRHWAELSRTALVAWRGVEQTQLFKRRPIVKKLISVAALGLLTLGFASPAAAYKFVPVNTAFRASGTITVSTAAVSIPCRANLLGTTVGGGKITSATFSGTTCAALTASGLPWSMTTGSQSGLRLHGVTVNALVLGICGPGTIGGTLSTFGRITFSGAGLPGTLGPCSVSATLHTEPELHIVGQ